MDFYEVLDQVVDLLKQRERVTYRALKRQFNLDDGFIADLKEEIIDAQRVAIEEDGRILVWTGATEEVSKPGHPEPPTVIEDVSPGLETSVPIESRKPDAERRQLTVMFCDLVDSTALSGQLDPEDLRDVIRAYQAACTEVIQRYEGHVAQLLGDGLLVYFGYPQAHEDDAQRAIRAGLGMVAAMDTLNQRLEHKHGIRLAIRVGTHTGLVVVGEMGGEGRQEQLALGETPNVAARIQGLADPDTIVMSEATSQLVQGFFHCEDLGEQNLRGVAQSINVHRVLQETGAQSRLDIATTRGLTPLVGRESEVALLVDRWQQAENGSGQVVLLSGEAGIGKSRLVQVLKEHVATTSHVRLECRSSPYYQNTALYPITELFQRTMGWKQDDTVEGKLRKLEKVLGRYRLALEETIPIFAPLMSLALPEDRYAPLNLTPQQRRQKTLEMLATMFVEEAERQPMLFIVEDLHWTDPTTLEMLGLVIDQSATASIFTLFTCRPEFQPVWPHRSHLAEVSLNRLSKQQMAQMAARVVHGKQLPAEVIGELMEKTDGVPLYLEEMTKAIIESGALKEHDAYYELTGSIASLAIPATLNDSLMARLDRLPSAKGVAQLGAVIGRQFSYELLSAVIGLDENTLQQELGHLVDAELIYPRGVWPDTIYTFKHALIQDTAYESLLRSTKQGYHRRIAAVLEERFPETAENQPELLAYHYDASGQSEKAIDYWHQAGQRAVERSANAEAASHLTLGLERLKTLPDSAACAQQELDLLITLGPALIASKGQAAQEVIETYARARELCREVGETRQLGPVLVGLRTFYIVQGDYETAQELGEQLLAYTQRQHDTEFLLPAHQGLGQALFFLGSLTKSLDHYEQGIALYNVERHRNVTRHYVQDIGIQCISFTAWLLWVLGYPDRAQARIDDTLNLARELSHPFSLTRGHHFAAVLAQFHRETQATREHAAATLALAAEQGLVQWEAGGNMMHGWALAVQGQREEGMAQLHRGLSAWRGTRAQVMMPYYLTLLVDLYRMGGQVKEGLEVVAEALVLVAKNKERLWEAEIHRVRGELLRSQSSDYATEAETCFHRALEVSHHQEAKSLELRAATSLGRLWQSQDKRQDAYDLLEPVYNWFTEGFDTADLQDAKALLDELAE